LQSNFSIFTPINAVSFIHFLVYCYLVMRLRMVELYLLFPPCLHAAVLN
jgi:hypothetical protein